MPTEEKEEQIVYPVCFLCGEPITDSEEMAEQANGDTSKRPRPRHRDCGTAPDCSS